MSAKVQIKFTWAEIKAIMLALMDIKEVIEDNMNNPKIDWNIDARESQREIVMAAKSAIKKIHQITGISMDLPGYKPGDENEFLNKKS